MRYFTYISDAKVDLILGQVPQNFREKISAEIGFNLGLLSGKLSSETHTLENRVARLRVAEEYIRKTEKIGTASAPAKWIKGSLPMFSVSVGEGCLLYIGEGASWVLALAGSATHLAGGAAPEAAPVPFSFLHNIAKHVAGLTDKKPEWLDSIPEQLHPDLLAAGVHEGVESWFKVICWCTKWRERSLSQQLSFLAKRLADQPYGGRRIVLATPLYIEVMD